MSTAVTPYLQRLALLKKQVRPQAEKIVSQLQTQITDFVTEEQLLGTGKDGKGKFLGHYSSYTIALKKAKGEVYNRTTLLDTGEFYDDFFAVGKNSKIEIFSTNEKTPDLVKRYGKDIFLLSVENNKIVNDTLILPKLIEWLLQSLPPI